MSTRLLSCRSCGAHELVPLLSLGETPLANALLTPDQLGGSEAKYPLDLVFCPICSLVQITETVPPEQLFGEYLYFSSFSDTMLAHARSIVQRVVAERGLGRNHLAVEVASNDGYLLQYYKEAQVPVLGIEPATNIARVAEERGIPTVCEFFGVHLAERLAASGKRADAIHANNVLAHVPDLNGFVRGLQRMLQRHGTVIVEVPYVKDMIDGVEFDTIYHEHLCYFSLTALDSLFRRNGLVIHDVEHLPIHGGSLRIFASAQTDERRTGQAVLDLLEEEARWCVRDAQFYHAFATRVESLKIELRDLLSSLRAQGKRIAAYGASAKGSTLLNYFEIGRETLEFVADRSTVKQGRYTPGTQLEIRAPDALVDSMPDYVLLLTWNFASEILQQQASYRERGGRFIVPIPELRIV